MPISLYPSTEHLRLGQISLTAALMLHEHQHKDVDQRSFKWGRRLPNFLIPPTATVWVAVG